MNALHKFLGFASKAAPAALLTAGMLASDIASAANVTWTGANNSFWSATSSWVGGTAPVNNDSVYFGTTGGQTSRLNQTLSLVNLNFDSANKSYTINSASNATLTVNNISNNSSASQSVNATVSLAGGTVGGSSNIGLSVVNGSGNVTKNGAGQLTIASGSYSGTLTVDAGTFLVNGDLGSADVVVNAGGTLNSSPTTTATLNSVNVAGGTFNPGTTGAIQSLNVNNGVTLGSGSQINMEVADLSSDAITSDTLAYGGNLNLSFSDPTNVVFNWFENTPSPTNTSWALFTSNSTPSGAFDSVDVTIGATTYSFTSIGGGVWRTVGDIGLGSPLTGGFNGFLFSENTTSFNSENGVVNLTAGTLYAVPEPSTIVFAGIGVAMFGWSTWTRRRAQARRKVVGAASC